MDNAVALIQTYLQLNGYFTLTELPLYRKVRHQHYVSATDLDILAVRFPNAGHYNLAKGACELLAGRYDTYLGGDPNGIDMIIGEVKEGKGRINKAGDRIDVLCSGIMRFGCCDSTAAHQAAVELMRNGVSRLPSGHTVRLLVFASEFMKDDIHQIAISHVIQKLQEYVQDHFDILKTSDLKDPILGLFTLLKKAKAERI
jgi:hypothetical protein